MICFNTERMIAKTEMQIIDGILTDVSVQPSTIDILRLSKRTGLESAFLFFDKTDINTRICHISITRKRNRFELSYGTEEQFRNCGYMKEALSHLVGWIFSNTKENEIWGLPNGDESKHILQTCGFTYCEPLEQSVSMGWYKIEKSVAEDEL